MFVRNRKMKSYLEPLKELDRKSTRLNSSHVRISYAVFCLKKKKTDYAAHVPVIAAQLENLLHHSVVFPFVLSVFFRQLRHVWLLVVLHPYHAAPLGVVHAG